MVVPAAERGRKNNNKKSPRCMKLPVNCKGVLSFIKQYRVSFLVTKQLSVASCEKASQGQEARFVKKCHNVPLHSLSRDKSM